jgi:hypothetical protein
MWFVGFALKYAGMALMAYVELKEDMKEDE